jgi:hypothetical protein
MAETRFEGRSPVARYWLSKCEGFAVAGGERGVVEELIRDADPFVTTRLVVRTGRRRRAVVPAEAVAAVDPAERVVFVTRGRRKQPTRAAMTRAAAGARLRSAGTARGLAYARREMATRAAPAVENAGRTTLRVAAVTAASTRRHAPRIATGTARTFAHVRDRMLDRAALVAASTRRHTPRVGPYARRRIEPLAALVARSFSLLIAELAATARMTSATGRGARRQFTEGSSGIRDTSS